MGAGVFFAQHEGLSSTAEMVLLRRYNRERHDEERLGEELLRTEPDRDLAGKENRPRDSSANKRHAAARTRARDNTLLRIYNNNRHTGLGKGIDSLRSAFRRRAIRYSGWMSVASASAAFVDAGVNNVSNATILVLARSDENSRRVQHTGNKDVTTKTIENPHLVHWPSIVVCLEEGLSPNERNDASLPCERGSPRSGSVLIRRDTTDKALGKLDSPSRTRDDDAEKSAIYVDSLIAIQDQVALDAPGLEKQAFAVTPEPPDRSTAASLKDTTRHPKADSNWNGRYANDCATTVGQALAVLERALRNGDSTSQKQSRLPQQSRTSDKTARVKDAMEEIRMVLESAGFRCHALEKTGGSPLSERNRPATSENSDNQRATASVHHHQYEAAQGSGRDEERPGSSAVLPAIWSVNLQDDEDVISTACMAGKRGDVAALKDFRDRVDLRQNDSFGRNALYYSCLCGHMDAVHLLTSHVYGGIKGIPPDELRECRKNALTDEIRRFLDTGILQINRRPKASSNTTANEDRCAGSPHKNSDNVDGCTAKCSDLSRVDSCTGCQARGVQDSGLCLSIETRSGETNELDTTTLPSMAALFCLGDGGEEDY